MNVGKRKGTRRVNDKPLYLWHYNLTHQHGFVPRDIVRLELRHQKKKLFIPIIFYSFIIN